MKQFNNHYLVIDRVHLLTMSIVVKVAQIRLFLRFSDFIFFIVLIVFIFFTLDTLSFQRSIRIQFNEKTKVVWRVSGCSNERFYAMCSRLSMFSKYKNRVFFLRLCVFLSSIDNRQRCFSDKINCLTLTYSIVSNDSFCFFLIFRFETFRAKRDSEKMLCFFSLCAV